MAANVHVHTFLACLHAERCMQEVPERARSLTPEAAGESDGERVVLDLVTDKEWQRLFAVLTISTQDRRTGEREQQHEPEQQQQLTHQRSSRAWDSPTAAAPAAGAAAAAAGTSAAAAAPTTPARHESEQAAAAPEAVTPTRRSFLATEFSRVQARLTPERQQGSAMEVMC